MRRSSKLPAVCDPMLGLMRDLDLPMTRAGYLEALTFPMAPTSPSDADLVAQGPEELPGKMPTRPTDVSE